MPIKPETFTLFPAKILFGLNVLESLYVQSLARTRRGMPPWVTAAHAGYTAVYLGHEMSRSVVENQTRCLRACGFLAARKGPHGGFLATVPSTYPMLDLIVALHEAHRKYIPGCRDAILFSDVPVKSADNAATLVGALAEQAVKQVLSKTTWGHVEQALAALDLSDLPTQFTPTELQLLGITTSSSASSLRLRPSTNTAVRVKALNSIFSLEPTILEVVPPDALAQPKVHRND